MKKETEIKITKVEIAQALGWNYFTVDATIRRGSPKSRLEVIQRVERMLLEGKRNAAMKVKELITN